MHAFGPITYFAGKGTTLLRERYTQTLLPLLLLPCREVGVGVRPQRSEPVSKDLAVGQIFCGEARSSRINNLAVLSASTRQMP